MLGMFLISSLRFLIWNRNGHPVSGSGMLIHNTKAMCVKSEIYETNIKQTYSCPCFCESFKVLTEYFSSYGHSYGLFHGQN